MPLAAWRKLPKFNIVPAVTHKPTHGGVRRQPPSAAAGRKKKASKMQKKKKQM